MEPTLEVKLLGELTVTRGGVEARLPQSKKTRALLGYLVATARPQRRTRLCSLLWDVADDPRGALRWCLSKIRPIVNQPGMTRIVTEGDTVVFDAKGARIDLFDARQAIGAGVDSLDTDTLLALAGSHRGEVLEGLEMSDFDEFQAWCLAEREEARSARAQVLRELIARLGEQPEAALPHARALVRIEPIDEGIRARLIELLSMAGRTAEARQQHEASLRQLREFGVEPRGLIEAAARGILERHPAVVGASSSPAARAAPTGETAAAALDVEAAELDSIAVFSATAEAPLIGRRAERARLTAVVEQIGASGQARLALISGEPGVGKTRLFAELLAQVGGAGGLVLTGRAYEAERGRPYGPWIDLLRSVPDLGLEDGSSPPGHLLSPLLPELSADEPTATREQMFAAIAALFNSLADRAPLVALALDDVQWIDEASAELLHFVARRLRERPLLIAMTARSGEIVDNEPVQRVVRSLRKERLLEELEVGPLGQKDTEALVATIAPSANAAEVYAQCAGNPLFALELARSGPRASRALPQSLTDVVRDRVERLSPQSADVLRWASTLGPSAALARLSALTELTAEELVTALELLERRALLTSDGTSYQFAHDVVRQVVYAELSQPRRQLMHAKIAQSIDLTRSGDGTIAAELAHHAHLAGNAAMAAQACIAAGQRSLKMFAGSDALALCRRGFRYIEKLDEPRRTAMAIDLWNIRLGAAVADDAEEAAAQLEALGSRALDAGDERAARCAFRLLGYLRFERGQNFDAARHMLNAARLTENNEGVERASALADAARCLVHLDRDLGHAEALALEARAIAVKAAQRTPTLADAEGMLRSYEGNVDAAASFFVEAAELARRRQDRLGEFEPLENLIMLKLWARRADEAVAAAARLLEIGARLREGSEGPASRALHAQLDYARGDASARQAVLAAQEELRVVDAKQRLSFVLLAMAQVDLDNGDASAARAAASEALALALAIKHRSYTAWARALISLAASASGDAAAAEEQGQKLVEEGTDELSAFAKEAVQRVL